MQDRDELEQFISDHKSQFDVLEPPREGWEAISKELEADQLGGQDRRGVYWKVAALLMIGFLTFLMTDKFKPVVVEGEELSASIEEFEELETFYTSIISKKEIKLEAELESNIAINYLQVDIEELEFLYNDLRSLYVQKQSTPEVRDRLVHLLRQRLHLINSQLDILQEDKVSNNIRKG
jgi:hypothetical protein